MICATASTLPPHELGHGVVALSIVGGTGNAIRSVRAMSNNSEAVIVSPTPPQHLVCKVGRIN